MNDCYLGDRGKVVIQQPRVSASVIIPYLQSEISFKSAILTKFFTGLQDSWLARLSYHLGDCKHWPACDMWLVNKRSHVIEPERWLVWSIRLKRVRILSRDQEVFFLLVEEVRKSGIHLSLRPPRAEPGTVWCSLIIPSILCWHWNELTFMLQLRQTR